MSLKVLVSRCERSTVGCQKEQTGSEPIAAPAPRSTLGRYPEVSPTKQAHEWDAPRARAVGRSFWFFEGFGGAGPTNPSKNRSGLRCRTPVTETFTMSPNRSGRQQSHRGHPVTQEMTMTLNTKTRISRLAHRPGPCGTHQDRLLSFFVFLLGFEKRLIVPFGGGQRWVEVRGPPVVTSIALPPAGGAAPPVDTGIRLSTARSHDDHVPAC